MTAPQPKPVPLDDRDRAVEHIVLALWTGATDVTRRDTTWPARVARMDADSRRFWTDLASSRHDADALWPDVARGIVDLVERAAGREVTVPCTLCGGDGWLPGHWVGDEGECGRCGGSRVEPCRACCVSAVALHDGEGLCAEHLAEAAEQERDDA